MLNHSSPNSSPDIFALFETNLNSLVSDDDLKVARYLPPIRKDSSTHMHGVGVYFHDELPLACIPTLEDPNESFVFSSLNFCTPLATCSFSTIHHHLSHVVWLMLSREVLMMHSHCIPMLIFLFVVISISIIEIG